MDHLNLGRPEREAILKPLCELGLVTVTCERKALDEGRDRLGIAAR
jgi:hypothetical protein